MEKSVTQSVCLKTGQSVRYKGEPGEITKTGWFERPDMLVVQTLEHVYIVEKASPRTGGPVMLTDPTKLQFRARSLSWIEERSTYLGGSDIAAIMGLDPYRTALGVYQEKKGLSSPLQINEPMVHGQNLELYVARCYRALTGRQIHKSHLYRHKDFPHLAVNPGYEIRSERPLRLLECRTTGYFAGQVFGQEGDGVPERYLVQCMWQLAITRRQVCDLAVLIGGQDFRIYTIERDEELITALIERANRVLVRFHSRRLPASAHGPGTRLPVGEGPVSGVR